MDSIATKPITTPPPVGTGVGAAQKTSAALTASPGKLTIDADFLSKGVDSLGAILTEASGKENALARIVFLEDTYSALDLNANTIAGLSSDAREGHQALLNGLREAILGSYSETGKRAYEGIGSHQPGSNFSDYQARRKAVFNDPKIFQIGTKVESARVAAPELTKPVTKTGTVVGADGSRYSIVSDEVADGDCGLNAVYQVLCTSDDSRARAAFDRAKSQLGYEVNRCMLAHYSVTSALNAGSTASGNQIATDLSVMFGGKYENFKAFVQSKSKTYLDHLAITEAPSTAEKEARMQRAKAAVAEFNEAVNTATNFTELGSKSGFSEIWNSNLAVKDYFSSYSHNDREVNHDQGSVYVARAHTHLTSDQISGLMLAKGYYLYDTGVHDSPAPGQTHSVLKFKHLTTNEEACIACTGRHGNVPTLADHWVHVKKSG